MENNNNTRQCFIRWANNTNTYEEDPLCEAKRTWGYVFLGVYDYFNKIYSYYILPKTKNE